MYRSSGPAHLDPGSLIRILINVHLIVAVGAAPDTENRSMKYSQDLQVTLTSKKKSLLAQVLKLAACLLSLPNVSLQ